MKKMIVTALLATAISMSMVACNGANAELGAPEVSENDVVDEVVEDVPEETPDENNDVINEEPVEEEKPEYVENCSFGHSDDVVFYANDYDETDAMLGVKVPNGFEFSPYGWDDSGKFGYITNDELQISYQFTNYGLGTHPMYEGDLFETTTTGTLTNDDGDEVSYQVMKALDGYDSGYLEYVKALGDELYLTLSISTLDVGGYDTINSLDVNEYLDLTEKCYFVIE